VHLYGNSCFSPLSLPKRSKMDASRAAGEAVRSVAALRVAGQTDLSCQKKITKLRCALPYMHPQLSKGIFKQISNLQIACKGTCPSLPFSFRHKYCNKGARQPPDQLTLNCVCESTLVTSVVLYSPSLFFFFFFGRRRHPPLAVRGDFERQIWVWPQSVCGPFQPTEWAFISL
jgi:hypothetical protein